jgi:extracellular factor (EF) 3-hydroxypalmitic acid methyl ester biosynthesis protein
MQAAPSPTVLVIADDLKLVESLRGAFGSACHIALSPSVEHGLERVRHVPGTLSAVLINLGLPGLDPVAAVSQIRAAHGDVTLLGFSPATNGHAYSLDDCQVVPLPVDWKDLRGLVDIQRSVPAPAPQTNGHSAIAATHLPTLPVLLPPPTSARIEQPAPPPPPPPPIPPPLAPPIAVELSPNFLRDDAARIEHANFFEARTTHQQGLVSGRILRVSPHFIVCEVLDPQPMLAPGWSADDARVQLAHAEAYRGPARLLKVVNTGNALICEWALQGRWQSVSPVSSASMMPQQQALAPFFDRLRILGRISEVFKAVVAEVATVLEEAKQCLDRLEVTVQPTPGQSRSQALRALLPDLQRDLFPALNQVFAKFEAASQSIPHELEAEYHSLVRQRLHPLMMCAPFIHHVYAKPLGFAGDYQALQQLVDDPFNGQTLFAKLLNGWLVLSPAGEAYRHRIALLTRELSAQANRCHQAGQTMRVLSVGCGAANEVTRFLAQDELSQNAEFTLVDFNAPTLAFAKQQIDEARREHWRLTPADVVQASMHSLVLDASRMTRKGLPSFGKIARAGGYEFIHCTGLFDYFSDRVCRRLLSAMHTMLAPGGRLIVCNFTPANPIRQFMKYVLDWNLIHRTEAQLHALLPAGVNATNTMSPGDVETYLLCDR